MSYVSDHCLLSKHLGLLYPVQALSCVHCKLLALQGLIDALTVEGVIYGQKSYAKSQIMHMGMVLPRLGH